jgi:NAD(P) transhydrogenase subunit alpha
MRLGVVLESDFETRVSIVPNSIPKLLKMGFEVIVEDGAGRKSGYPNSEYELKGASISNSDEVLGSDLVTSIGVPDFTKMKSGAMLACIADPFRDLEKTKQIIESGITLLSMEVIPRRLSKGQSMDVNSSQDNLSGYCAALKAAFNMPKLMPMMTTAAGTIRPAKFVIQGAAVAGLQAIATAKRLGAIVYAVDVRLAAKTDCESLGGRFIDVPGWVDAETSSGHANSLFDNPELMEAFDVALEKVLSDADALVTTARIFGRDAPKLFFSDERNDNLHKIMKEGSVVVDMNLDTGGNTNHSDINNEVVKDGVTFYGTPILCRTVPNTASMLYSNNVTNFVSVLVNEGALKINQAEQVLTGDEGGIGAGFGGILISEDGKIHANHSRLQNLIYEGEEE